MQPFAVIASLPESHRLALRPRFGQNCTQSAIAAELGISQNVSRRLAKITQVFGGKACVELATKEAATVPLAASS